MPKSIASQVMSEVVEEVGKSISVSVRPFLSFGKNVSHVASILTTAWTLGIVLFWSIDSEIGQVLRCIGWTFGCFAAFMVFTMLLWAVGEDSSRLSRRRHG